MYMLIRVNIIHSFYYSSLWYTIMNYFGHNGLLS